MSDRLSTLYQDVVAGSYDCVDRILLNGYFGLGHSAGGFRLCWRQLKGSDQTLDKTHLMRLPILAAAQPLRPSRGTQNSAPIDRHYETIRLARQEIFHELGIAA